MLYILDNKIGIEVNYYDLKLISSDGMEIRNSSKYSKLSILENKELAIKSSNEYIENKLIIDCNIISLNNDNDNSNVNTSTDDLGNNNINDNSLFYYYIY